MTFEDNATLTQLELEERFDEAVGELLEACALVDEPFEDHYNPHWDVSECDIEEIEHAAWRIAHNQHL